MNIASLRVASVLLSIAFSCQNWLPSSRADDAATATKSPPYLLQMIRDDAVHQELGLNAATIEQIDQAIAEVDPRWWVSRILPAETLAAEINELTEQLRASLIEILSDDQLQRLKQLERQAAGTRMLQTADAVERLAITASQSEQLKQRFAMTDEETTKIQKQLMDKTIDAEQAGRQTVAVQQEERQTLLQVLSEAQRGKIGAMVGAPFDFATVKRTYPRGPEFVTDGATWIDGEAVNLADLRGKVVVIFFYAFQCINCQRNFPHYLAWHREMADDGLVVIGIQSPETSAERNLAKVTAARISDGFEFPVLFDQASNNWRAWGTTMWPTTYLIDKDGFIRRWWQGEMNWQGTPGEQQMRATIEELLAE